MASWHFNSYLIKKTNDFDYNNPNNKPITIPPCMSCHWPDQKTTVAQVHPKTKWSSQSTKSTMADTVEPSAKVPVAHWTICEIAQTMVRKIRPTTTSQQPQRQSFHHWKQHLYGISMQKQQIANGQSKKAQTGQVHKMNGCVEQQPYTLGVTSFLNVGWHWARLYNSPTSITNLSVNFAPLLKASSQVLIFLREMHVLPTQLDYLTASKPYCYRSPKSMPSLPASSNNMSKLYWALERSTLTI